MSSPYPCKVCGLYFHYEQDMYACRTCYHNLKTREYNSPSHWAGVETLPVDYAEEEE